MKITIAHRYGSHLPILKAVGKKNTINCVVEIGCGFASTSCFLNKDVYPGLTSLYSYESALVWIKRVRKKNKDCRWKLIHFKNMSKLKQIKYLSPDLIFIDGTREARVYVLRKLNRLADIYVVHDTNIEKYEKTIRRYFKYYRFFDPPYDAPSTAIASNVVDIDINWALNWKCH